LGSAISPLDAVWFARAAAHQARLTMPSGALGRLLDLARQLCAVQETLTPHTEPAAVVVMAADHGVAEEEVSAFPQEVTGQMLANFLRGGAAINVLAKRQGTRVLVVDMGVKHVPNLAADEIRHSLLRETSLAGGTTNFLRAPAMSAEQAAQAQNTGRRVVRERLAPEGVRVVALGEMGIGNTTSASALAAALLGMPAAAVTGRGTGVDDADYQIPFPFTGKINKLTIAVDRNLPPIFTLRHLAHLTGVAYGFLRAVTSRQTEASRGSGTAPRPAPPETPPRQSALGKRN